MTVQPKCWDILEVLSMDCCGKACATNVLPGETAFYHKNFTRPMQVYSLEDCCLIVLLQSSVFLCNRHNGCGYWST